MKSAWGCLAMVACVFSSLAGEAQAASDVVIYAARASKVAGLFQVTSDSTAAGGQRIGTQDAGATKVATALAVPTSYFEISFVAMAGIPYHLWFRGFAQNKSFSNDSAYAQFSDSVDASGAAIDR